MIRLRNKKGELIEPPEDLGFLEVCDLDGNVACAVYRTKNGHIHFVSPDSKEAPRYKKIFNVEFTKISLVPDLIKD